MCSLDPPTTIFRPDDVATALEQVLAQVECAQSLQPAPFHFDPSASASTTGVVIATAYSQCCMPGLVTILADIFDRIGLPTGSPERRAAIASAVLASVPNPNAFHNADHTREVVSNLIWLLEANDHLVASGAPGAAPIDAITRARLLLAATVHDLGHDGTTNAVVTDSGSTYILFRLENMAFDLIRPILDRAGFEEEAVQQVRLLVRATDPAIRPAVRSFTDCALYRRPEPSEAMPELVRQLSTAGLAVAVALLSDADVLSSAGLTPEYHWQLSAQLAVERGVAPDPAAGLGFLEDVVGGSFSSAAGKLLDPNLARVRASLISGRC